MADGKLRIHFTGAGGVGMAGLAHLALDLGWEVTGSDVADSGMLESLLARGVRIWLGHAPHLPEGTDLLVHSSAVPEWDSERKEAAERGIEDLRRGDFLNRLALRFPVRVAVSGSHGKTSTSAMLAHILMEAGLEPGYLVGGKVNGWERSAGLGAGHILVTEVDESDGSQAGFPATMALVMNIDDDHSWGLGGTRALECCFLELAFHARKVLTWESENTRRLFGEWRRAELLSTPLGVDSSLPIPGWHARLDAAMALRAAELLGVERNRALAALQNFPGVSRRMSVRAKSADGSRVLIEDYAHHPTELQATLDALQEAYPGYRKLVVFQPHRMERVERYGARFAELLSCTDWCCVVAPFAAWRTDGHQADVHTLLADGIRTPHECLPLSEAVQAAKAAWQKAVPAVLAVIGAGDVTKIVPELADFCRQAGTN